jgi:UDP-N-acetylmuramoylalanine--D-glutamate ligase
MKIAILGFGREGRSILQFLRKNPFSKKDEIVICDRNPNPRIHPNAPNIKLRLGKNYLRNLSRFDVVFRSPGIPYNLPELVKTRKAGVRFSSATKLFFSAIGGSPPEADAPLEHACRRRDIKVIGITGTKGKGTTSTLIYKILKAANKNVFLAGNIGKSALDVLPKIKKGSFVILELSSFQLQDLAVSPRVAVVLDVFPDHQDSHQNLKEYYDAKTNIARFQKHGDIVFYFRDNPKSRWIARESRGRKIAVSEKGFPLFKPEDLKIKGGHNFRNAVMAAAVARHLGVPEKTILKAVKKFRGLEHRLEFVCELSSTNNESFTNKRIRNRDGKRRPIRKFATDSLFADGTIRFYNDSASTNPNTAAAAIKSFPGESKILIAGGYDKGLNYKPLAQALKSVKNEIKLVVLFGQNKKKIQKQIEMRNEKLEIKICKNLKSAVVSAYRKALSLISRFQFPISIIFSPGAASFDQFQNYADRGEQFKKIVRGLTKNIN